MVTRAKRVAQFESDALPAIGAPVEVLCEDYRGTYTPPFLCRWTIARVGECQDFSASRCRRFGVAPTYGAKVRLGCTHEIPLEKTPPRHSRGGVKLRKLHRIGKPVPVHNTWYTSLPIGRSTAFACVPVIGARGM
jgi:hypothetical protein